MPFQGLTPELQTPADLLAKLRHDLRRLERRPIDVYAAFDFYVTAEHMPEWLYAGDTAKANTLRDNDLLLHVVSHVASGAKHFKATAPKHTSVKDVRTRRGPFDPAIFDPAIFDVGGLVIWLEGPEAAAFGAQVNALALAQQVYDFWADRLGLLRSS